MIYKESGVDIDEAYRGVSEIKNALGENFGSFAGLFDISNIIKNYKEPVLVSSTDGVGTKVMLLKKYERYRTLAQDLIAMNLNDLVCLGARPLFFLDYYSTGKLDSKAFKKFLKNLVDILNENDCKLLGGETAELPGLLSEDHFDVSGFVVGIVEKRKILGKFRVKEDDILLGLTSNGIHSNGFSLVRKLIDDGKLNPEEKINGELLIDLILKPTKIYSRVVLDVLDKFEIHACSHITGGGIIDNLERVIPGNLVAYIDKNSWKVPELFRIIQNAGNILESEMYRVFNMGVGFVMIVPEKSAKEIQEYLKKQGENSFIIGRITKIEGKENNRVRFR